jgi:hypothetical protein
MQAVCSPPGAGFDAHVNALRLLEQRGQRRARRGGAPLRYGEQMRVVPDGGTHMSNQ